MTAKSRKKDRHRWLRDIDDADNTIDHTMERILKRDGRRAYQGASSNLLTFYTNTIVHMDGGPARLIGMLRLLEEMHVRITNSNISRPLQ